MGTQDSDTGTQEEEVESLGELQGDDAALSQEHSESSQHEEEQDSQALEYTTCQYCSTEFNIEQGKNSLYAECGLWIHSLCVKSPSSNKYDACKEHAPKVS